MLKKIHAMLSLVHKAPAAGSSRTHRQPSRFRPGMEALENRLTPATFKPTTLVDVVNPNDGDLSLREAIALANATAEKDTIKLKAGEYRLALGDLGVTNAVAFKGKGGSATFIDGGGQYRLFDVHGTDDIALSRLRLSNEAPEPVDPAGSGVVYLDMGSTGQGPNSDGDCGNYADLANGIEDSMHGLEMINQFGDRLDGTFATDEDADMFEALSQLRDDVISEAEDGGCFVVYMSTPPTPVLNATLVTQIQDQTVTAQLVPLTGITNLTLNQTVTAQWAPLMGITGPTLVAPTSNTVVIGISASSPAGSGTEHDNLCKALGELADGWYHHAEADRRSGDSASEMEYTDLWTTTLSVAEKIGCIINYA